jgi:demethylmenaquinone methyltransferase/2-methoxy-6-polyprenyl-1,4-benzoquinol methylase
VKGQDPAFIKNLFGNIASRYDRANDFMTFGLARRWRKQLIDWSQPQKGDSVFDCATGTGDLALEFKKRLGPRSRVVGGDFCEAMLKKGTEKAFARRLDVEFIEADAMSLPFPNQTFDIVTMAYGIRNVANPHQVLKELARITKPGGRVLILETGNAQNALLKPLMRFYFDNIVPKVGGLISGNSAAYDYLNRSSQSFPGGDDFVALMKSTEAYLSVDFRSLWGGASFLYRGTPFA